MENLTVDRKKVLSMMKSAPELEGVFRELFPDLNGGFDKFMKTHEHFFIRGTGGLFKINTREGRSYVNELINDIAFASFDLGARNGNGHYTEHDIYKLLVPVGEFYKRDISLDDVVVLRPGAINSMCDKVLGY
jgi:hypothetical protein